jgi:Patatin-like phospholipase
MKHDDPLSFEQVLADEFTALRPGPTFAGRRADLYATMHRDPAPLSALCVSGGGIRSATFALGVIQGLAERGLLPQFDYLSTVSGGGYIGSWLTAWAHRAGGIERVAERLDRNAAPPPGEPDPLEHLRAYNSYLSPRRGALSTDLWTLAVIILRNILLNWLVLIPLVLFVVIVPRLYLSVLALPEQRHGKAIFDDDTVDYADKALDVIALSPQVQYLLPVLFVGLFATALFNTLRFLPGLGGRDHSTYDHAVMVLAPIVGAVLGFLMFDSLHYLGTHFGDRSDIAWLVGWCLLPCALAWAGYLLTDRRPISKRLELLFSKLSLGIAAMAAGTGTATWLITNHLLWHEDKPLSVSWAAYVTLGPPLVLLGFCIGCTLFVGLTSTSLEEADREWMSRTVAGILLVAVAWGAICAVVLMLPAWALDWHPGLHGLLATLAGLSAWLSTAQRAVVANVNPGTTALPTRRSPVFALATGLAGPLFIMLLAGALSVLANLLLVVVREKITHASWVDALGQPIVWNDHYGILGGTHPTVIAVFAIACLGFSALMSRYVNINTFSLQGMYRARLVRAYLGASNPRRDASTFTGFARGDDIAMADIDATRRPLHVVNVTLNLVAGKRLAWQQRKAESFTISPMHCGTGTYYRPSSRYAGGISLGTAVAISGAAASPNMGYHSSPVVGFIMTLFNARLGSWLGNPGPPGVRSWTYPGPRFATAMFVREALGRTTDRRPYVYLSDGGHFENLGMYEMVRRRCRLIVVVDGGCDPDHQYADLGNALRKIRIDFRIPIEFDDEFARGLRARSRRCAVGTIRYSEVDGEGTDGTIVYIKPMLLGDEPPDVASYAATHPAFPHESTADQWFDESQTESYRMLGLLTVDQMCEGWTGGGFADFRRHLESVYLA